MRRINMITIIDASYCMVCNEPNSLSLYDKYNNKISISKIIEFPSSSLIDLREYVYIECDKCNSQSNIDWSAKDRFPRQLIEDYMLNNFINRFTDNHTMNINR